MKIFTIKETTSVVCNREKTRNGFKHIAVLIENGREVDKVKINYLNRTWERYEYESILHKMLDKHGLPHPDEKTEIKKDISELRAVGALAMFGDVISKDKKESNAFKKKMISAVPGVIIPDDFEALSEEEKARRLDGAIDELIKE